MRGEIEATERERIEIRIRTIKLMQEEAYIETNQQFFLIEAGRQRKKEKTIA